MVAGGGAIPRRPTAGAAGRRRGDPAPAPAPAPPLGARQAAPRLRGRVICPRPRRRAVDAEERSGAEYIARHLHAIAEERRRPPVTPTGEAFPVRVGGATREMDRAVVEDILRTAGPRGRAYLYHYINFSLIDVRDFEAACGRFGLQGALEDITYDEIEDEIRARRERGAAPSTGMLPVFLDEVMPRERADARIAIVERRIAGARAAPSAA